MFTAPGIYLESHACWLSREESRRFVMKRGFKFYVRLCLLFPPPLDPGDLRSAAEPRAQADRQG